VLGCNLAEPEHIMLYVLGKVIPKLKLRFARFR